MARLTTSPFLIYFALKKHVDAKSKWSVKIATIHLKGLLIRKGLVASPKDGLNIKKVYNQTSI
jgi:hypothetical protein